MRWIFVKITITIALAILLVACASAPTTPAPNTDAQVVNVGVSGASYTFDKSVEAGKPVQLVFDMNQLQGCSRAVTIPDYEISKLVSNNDNMIEFTPLKSGPIRVSCSMSMYNGELMVS